MMPVICARNSASQIWVYIATRPDKAHKIGISREPRRRAISLSSRLKCKVNIVHADSFLYAVAKQIEAICHKLLQDRALGGEWFRIDMHEAMAVLNKAVKMRFSGAAWQEYGLSIYMRDYKKSKEVKAKSIVRKDACRDFAGRLRAARLAAGLTQVMLGRMAGVHPSSVRSLESGGGRASLAARVKLAAVLHMPECDALKPD